MHRAKVRTRIMGHLRQLMQFASVQESARNIGGLKGSPLGWRMSCQVTADRHQDVAALGGYWPILPNWRTPASSI